MKRKIVRGLVLALMLFSITVVGLAFVPHRACACGDYEDGSQLTHFINAVSEKLLGKPIIEKNRNPFSESKIHLHSF